MNVARPIGKATIEGVTVFTIVSTLVVLRADKGVVSGGYRL
jgi:hypothetical protein